MTVLLGRTTGLAGASDFVAVGGNPAAWPFIADESGDLVTIFCHGKATNADNASFELGIYENSANLPTNLLGKVALVGGGWQGTGIFSGTLAVPVPIVASTQYWLALWTEDRWDFLGEAAGNYRERSAGTATLVDPFGGSNPGSVDIVIWGEDAGTPPDSIAIDPDWSKFPKYKLRRS